jgi:hypothetical protein
MRSLCLRLLLGIIVLAVTLNPLRAQDATARKSTASATKTTNEGTIPLPPIPVHSIGVNISELDNVVSRPLTNYTAAIVANGITLWDFLPLDQGPGKNARTFQIADNADKILVYVRGTGAGVKYPANLQLDIGIVTSNQTVAVVLTPVK